MGKRIPTFWRRFILYFGCFLLAIYLLNLIFPTDDAIMVFLILLFQILIIYSLVKDFRKLWITRKGPFVAGEVIQVRKIVDDSSESYTKYIATVEFSWPDEAMKYKVEFDDTFEIESSKIYEVWVNRKDPAKSIVRDKFDLYWWVSNLLWTAIVIVLGYINFLRIQKL